MSMFCYQCQETTNNTGCVKRGTCGKTEETAGLQDLLIYVLKGISVWGKRAVELRVFERDASVFITEALFATITNANFDDDRFVVMIKEGLVIRQRVRDGFLAAYKKKSDKKFTGKMPDCATWSADSVEEFNEKAQKVGVLATDNEDVRSLRELVIYGLKGLAAYVEHAAVLGYKNDDIYRFVFEALESTTRDLPVDEMVGMVLKTGEMGVQAMALLDKKIC